MGDEARNNENKMGREEVVLGSQGKGGCGSSWQGRQKLHAAMENKEVARA